MADKTISALTAVTTPLAGTEVLPIVQSGSTKNVSITNLAAGSVKSNSTTGVLEITGPAAASTRVMTTPDSDFTVVTTGDIGSTVQAYDADTAKLDVAQTWTAKQTLDEAAANSYELRSGGIVTEATTSRTLGATDNGKVIYCTSGSATTITCDTGLGAGFNCTIIQGGAGKVTVAAGTATLNSYSGLLSAMGQYAVISLISPVADEFIAAGNLGV